MQVFVSYTLLKSPKQKVILNYFINFYSGMDAQVAYGFHHLRDEKPYLANGPLANKVYYTCISCYFLFRVRLVDMKIM